MLIDDVGVEKLVMEERRVIEVLTMLYYWRLDLV